MRISVPFFHGYILHGLCAIARASTSPGSSFIEVECPDSALIREAKVRDSAENPLMNRVTEAVLTPHSVMSMLTGSGFLLEMEKYGLVDCLNYVTGTSGGSWILAKLILNNFRFETFHEWDLTESLLKGVPDMDISESSVVTMLESDDLDELFSADDWFYQKLSQASKLWTRSFEPPRSLVAPFEDFQMRLEELMQSQRCVFKKKRSSDTFSSMKQTLMKVFNSDDKISSEIGKIMRTSNEFRQILQFYIDLHLKVKAKKLSGFSLSFTDYWGHALADGIAPSIQQSSISSFLDNSPRFHNFETPLPIFVANCKNGNLRNAVFEFTPFEFGSWTNLRLFMRLKYLGSHMAAGKPSKCFTGFDEVSFITATSSSIFNNVLMCVWQLIAPSLNTRKAVGAILSTFSLAFEKSKELETGTIEQNARPEYAIYHPNPFFQYPGVTDLLAQESRLYLVDGGEDGQNIPIGPLLIPERQLDVIFALDSSSDIDSFPNGTMLRNFYRDNYISEDDVNIGSSAQNAPYQDMPYIPPSEDFVEQGLLSRPVAFGCHLSSFPNVKLEENANLTAVQLPPILVYHANANHSFSSNVSTFKLKYTGYEVQQMLQNGKDIFSLDSSPKYKRCLACIIIKRSYDRAQILAQEVRLPFFCEVCFDKYCYN
ncbi:LANO_0G14048g1_1 [Lachancea nothofagi CBS 11611]|uniref:Lysophospholipase n=1 Tax=Lachancea nothofagi CBS 11611 TaxID=1266666 RepID=A0A1G4KK26_9SACH|nr:LANO_0G14048g1_1 [Lachancea nothofagi CBS 11611]